MLFRFKSREGKIVIWRQKGAGILCEAGGCQLHTRAMLSSQTGLHCSIPSADPASTCRCEESQLHANQLHTTPTATRCHCQASSTCR